MTDEERTEEPETESPEQGDVAPEPTAEEPAAEEPAAEEPVAEEPAEDPPATEEPAAEAEAVEEPAAEVDAKPSTPQRKREPKEALPPGADLEPISLEGGPELTAEERAALEAEAEERARLEAAEVADADELPVPRRDATEIPADTSVQATGKRKSSIARVVVRPGKGAFEINSKPMEEYFPRHHHREMARQPLVVSGFEETVDVRVRVHGGGISGQAGAVRHGVARALTEIDAELRKDLKRRGMLTRDARAKERRKAGFKKARKKPQFSKR